MKFSIVLCLFAISMFWLSSCSNELIVNAPPVETPVVFGLLDVSSKRQFIKVERAFIEEQVSALVLAQDPSQLYYDEATVQLIELIGNSTGQVIDLQRVDGADIGLPKKEGVFASTPNYIYTTEQVLNPESRYRLLISINDGEIEALAETQVIDQFKLSFPQNNRTLNILPGSVTALQWTPPPHIAYYDVLIKLFITEGNNPNPALNTVRTFEWLMFKSLPANQNFMNIRANNSDFYNQLYNTLINEPLVARTADSAHIIINAGGFDLEKYVSINNINTGITASQDLPVYTNIDGGIGLFSTRYTSFNDGYMIGSTTKDSLANNHLTRNLGFQF